MKEDYVPVECRVCGKGLGFVVASGHRAWECVECAGIDPAYGAKAVYPGEGE